MKNKEVSEIAGELSKEITPEDFENFDEYLSQIKDIPEEFKEKKRYKNKLKKEVKRLSIQARTKKLAGIKDDYQNKLSEFEKQIFIKKRNPYQWVKEQFFGEYFVIKVIRKTKRIKTMKGRIHGNIVTSGKDSYRIEPEAVYYDNGKPVSFYFDKNPNPILFDIDKKNILLNSESLYSAFNNKVVSDLITPSMTKGQKITMGVVIVSGLILMGTMWFLNNQNPTPIMMLIPLKHLMKRK